MASFNKVILIGNLTRDPELRYTPRGVAIVEIGLAVNRTWKNEHGEKQEETTFVDVTYWGKSAEIICKYMSKGSALCVEGRLALDRWVDRESGKNRQKLKVVGENFQFLSSGGDGGGREAASALAEGGPDETIPF